MCIRDLIPGSELRVKWEIKCKGHAARSANRRGGMRCSEPVWPDLVVVSAPLVDLFACLGKISEPVHVQTVLAELAVE